MFKRHSFKIFRCNSTDPSFNTHKFLGEKNSNITKLFEKEAVNLMINEIADDSPPHPNPPPLPDTPKNKIKLKKTIKITKSKVLK